MPRPVTSRGNRNIFSFLSRAALFGLIAGLGFAVPAQAAIEAGGDPGQVFDGPDSYPPGVPPDPWNVGDILYIGNSGIGWMKITGGSSVSSTSGFMGVFPVSYGTVTVDGVGSVWTVSSGITVGFQGGGTLNITGGGKVSVSDVTLGVYNTAAGTINLDSGGVLETNTILRGQGSAALNFDGGILRATAGKADFFANFVSGDITFKAGGAIIDSNGYAIGVNSPLGGLGGLTKTGAGTLTLSATNSYTGATTINAGTLALAGSGSIAASSGVRLATGGVFDISGTTAGATIKTLNNTADGETGTVSLDSRVLTITDGGLFGGVISGTSGGLTLAGGELALTGASTYAGATTISSATLNITGGGSVSDTTSYIGYNNTGSTGTGTVTVDGAGSTWTNSGGLYVGYNRAGALNITGGGSVSNTDGFIGWMSTSPGTATVDGAGSTWTNSGGLVIGYGNVGTLNITGGGKVSAALVTVGMYNMGTLNITSGGLLETGGVSMGDYGGLLNFDGGILRATADNANFIDAFPWYGLGTFEAGGAIIDSNGYAIGVNSPLDGVGGLTKTGAGTLTLSGANTYSGVTIINAGTLALAGGGTIAASSDVRVATGAVFDISGTTAGATIQTLNNTASGQTGTVSLGDQTLTITGGGLFGGVISGASGGLTLTGGELTLTGASTYAGATTINSATLNITGGGIVSDRFGSIGDTAGSIGTVTVEGTSSTWMNSNYLYVGKYGDGTLNITDGASVSDMMASIASSNSDSVGVVMVRGTDSKGNPSTWSNSYHLIVGQQGSGRLDITDGGLVTLSGSDSFGGGYIGGYITGEHGTGVVTVSGAGSKLINSNELYIGYSGNGTLNIKDGGSVSNLASGNIGYNTGSVGTVTVDGKDSTWKNLDLVVGMSGSGTLSITGGGIVTNTNGYISYRASSDSTVTVDGAGSTWTNSGYLGVGASGNGTLNIKNGGSVSSASGFIGGDAGSDGTVTVDGIDEAGHRSTWTNNSDLYVGNWGSGKLNITGGGAVSSASGYIGYAAGSSGTVTVDGAGSKWEGSGALTVGRAGVGELTITNSGFVSAAAGISIGGQGTLTLVDSGSIAASSDLKLATGALFDISSTTAGATIKTLANTAGDQTGTVSLGKKTLIVTGGGAFGGVLSGEGGGLTLTGGTLTLSGENSYDGATTINGGTLALLDSGSIAASSGVRLATGGIFDISGTTAGTTIKALSNTVAGQTGRVSLGDQTLTITGGGSFGGAISGEGGGLTLSGGTLTLTGANTYTGLTTINPAATLNIGDATHSGSIKGAVNNNQGNLAFYNASDASGATITNNNYGQINFNDTSSAGSATITNTGLNTIVFSDFSSAADATITNDGYFSFNGAAAAGRAAITNNGCINFNGTSSAGGATISNDGYCGVFFSDASSAGSSTITNNSDYSSLAFYDTSSAGDATLINKGSVWITFSQTSDAGRATIINYSYGGGVGFSDTSSASDATITNYGLVAFNDTSTAGDARLVNAAGSGGVFDFSYTTGPAGDGKISAGSIEGGGFFYLGGNELTVGSNNLDTIVSGVIADGGDWMGWGNDASGASLVKTGTGRLTLSGENTYTGNTTISLGTLEITGSGGITSNVTNMAAFENAGMVAGSVTNSGIFTQTGGTVTGGVTNAAGATVNADGGVLDGAIVNSGLFNIGGAVTGDGSFTNKSGGTLTVSDTGQYTLGGAFTQQAGAMLNISIGNNNPAITAASAALDGSLNVSGYSGQSYTVIHTTGGVSGDFANLSIGGAASAVDYLMVTGGKSLDGMDYLIDTILSWNAAPTVAHGLFTLTDDSEAFTVSTALADRGGPFTSGWDGKSLTKNGAGALTLSAINSYTGATTINGGTLALLDSGSIAASSGVRLATGGIFDISGTTAGTTIKALSNTVAGQTGTVSLGDQTLTITGGGSFGGAISGEGGGLTLSGGTLTLTGANTYTGLTTINPAATLNIGDATHSGSIKGAVNNNQGNLAFYNASDVSGTTITNNSGSLVFWDTSTAGNAAIANNNYGRINFNGTSSAGSATITNDNWLDFNDDADAGHATIINTNFGMTHFNGTSSAGGATISNDDYGGVSFCDTSSAGNATIINSNDNAWIGFANTSDAGNATITNNNGGWVGFFGASSASGATITNDGNGLVVFDDTSTAGGARLVNTAGSGGVFDFSYTTGPAGDGKISAGSIEGGGFFYLGGNELTVGSNNLDTTVSGVIADGGINGGEGGSLVKTGAGKLTLSGQNSYTGATTIKVGELVIASTGSISSNVTNDATVENAGTVTGSVTNSGTFTQTGGTVTGGVTNEAGATVNADGGALEGGIVNSGLFNIGGMVTGDGSFTNKSGGTLTVSETGQYTLAGAFTQNAGATLNVTIGANDPAITAASAALDGTLNVNGYSGASYTVIHTTGDGISGDFASLSIGGAASAVDYLMVTGSKSLDGMDYLIDTTLSWKAAPADAHGAFTLTDANEAFTVSAALADRGDGPFASGWDGQSLSKNGAGRLTLAGENTYSGATTINGGTLEVTGNLGGGDYGGNIKNDGELIFNQAADQSLSGVISGTGSLTKDGSGRLKLSGDSSGYSGGFTLAAGEVFLTSTGKLGGSFLQEAGTTFNSANGATLNNATFKGQVALDGTLNLASGAFDGANVDFGDLMSGNKIVASGAIDFAGTSGISVDASNVTTNSSFTLMSAGTSLTGADKAGISATGIDGKRAGSYFTATELKYGVLTGPASLTWNGTAAATDWNALTTNTNWRAGFATYFVTGDSVLFDNGAANKIVNVDAGGVSVGTMSVTGSGYTFNLVTGNSPAISSTGNIDLGGAALNITGYTPDETIASYPPGGNVQTVITVGGVLTGFNPAVTVAGQASVDFLSASAFQAGNDVKVETRLTWYSTDPSRPAHGDFTIAAGESFTLGAALADNTDTSNFGAGWDGKSLTKLGGGRLILAGDNSYSGDTTISVGALEVTGSLGGGNYGGDIKNDGALTFNQAADQNLSGVISGTGSLTKDGSGTLTLSGNNTYTGPTEVQAGTLALAGDGRVSPILALYEGSAFNTGGTNVNYLTRLDVYGGVTWNGDLSMGAGQAMNFYLPATLATGDTILTVTNGNASIGGSTLTWGFAGDDPLLQAGDQIKLIDVATPGKTLSGTPDSVTGRQGVTLDYTFDVTTVGNQLVATVAGASASEQSKSLSEGFVSGPAVVNQTADFVADKGTTQAVEAAGGSKPGAGKQAAASAATGYGLGTFGAATGGQSRYNTGSHADVSSFSLMAGVAWGNNLDPGRLTLGAFFEYGNGSYDTYNSFADAADVHGEGDIYHLGGGVLGRLDFSQSRAGNFYTEAGVRGGSVHNDYKNGNFSFAGGPAVKAGYKSDAAYYGAHAGLGYVWHLTEKTALDLYGKYFWTRQNGDSVRLSTGDPIRFDNIDSQRLRLGGRFSYAVNGFIAPYVGAAYEQEFDGEARATANGLAMQAPSLQGGTGIGELGLTFKATKAIPLSVDLGVQGYVGTREGVTGSLQVKYEF